MKKEVTKTSLYGLLIPLNDTWFLDIVKVNIVKRDESLIKPAIEQTMLSPTRPYASKQASPASQMIKIEQAIEVFLSVRREEKNSSYDG